MSDHLALHRRFHAHGIHVDLGHGGLARVEVPGDFHAEIYLHGAQLTAWRPRGERPVLWLSPNAVFADGAAIRGGIPICFPWFGPHADQPVLPAHGFARLRAWTLDAGERLADGRVRLTFGLESDERTRALWPQAFLATYQVTIGATLELELRMTNTGTSPFTLSAALHSYLMVADVRRVRVLGLAGCDYLARETPTGPGHEGRSAIIPAGEIDRTYQTTRARATIVDPVWGRNLHIDKHGSNATVLWNPWAERTARLSDMPVDGWESMLCLETVHLGQRLEPDATHSLGARIAVERA